MFNVPRAIAVYFIVGAFVLGWMIGLAVIAASRREWTVVWSCAPLGVAWPFS
jgi:hypothetical protein